MQPSRGEPTRSSLRELGVFLRTKRRLVPAGQNALWSNRRRLGSGLNREEAAMLADIGSSWYARLEAGRVERPSIDTVLRVARALQLTPAETTYALDLAGLLRSVPAERRAGVFQPVNALFEDAEPISLSFWDDYCTAIGWNAVADGMFGFSNCADDVARNAVARLGSERALVFFGDAYEEYARNLVGRFRRAYVNDNRNDTAQAVFELAQKIPIFVKFWDEHVVAEETTDPSRAFVRHHERFGSFSAMAADFRMNGGDGILRIVAPADDDSRVKFIAMGSVGRSSSSLTVPLLRGALT